MTRKNQFEPSYSQFEQGVWTRMHQFELVTATFNEPGRTSFELVTTKFNNDK